MKFQSRKFSGQMLIEIIVAIGVIGLVLIGVSDLMVRSSRVVTFQKQKDEALVLIEGILNEYRGERDENPSLFYDNVTGETRDPCIDGKTYVCVVTINKTADTVDITVRAEWDDGGQVLSVSLSQSLGRYFR